jgi:hypothetical protein
MIAKYYVHSLVLMGYDLRERVWKWYVGLRMEGKYR